MASTTTGSGMVGGPGSGGQLQRAIGFWGLTFISLGSIIGSGWLLGALYAAEKAGPASLISWVLAGLIMIILALVHAEMGTTYPVAGGTARFPAFAFGPLAGFTAGWAAWLQAVTIAPIEVEASLEYLDNIGWVRDHLNLLNSKGNLHGWGLVIAILMMLMFTTLNIVGVKALSDSNTIAVLWKFAVPLLTVIVLLTLRFHGSNFHAGGGFMPYGWHGVFAALPAGVVFAVEGFEQAIQMAGEARNPGRDLGRAIILATLVGVALYIALEIAFIGGLDPAGLVHGWSNPIGKSDFGPYATIATAAGAGWLAVVLYIDAFISPAGTGLIYVGTSSRISYALGKDKTLPGFLGTVWRGVPIGSILTAFVVGVFCFLPFPSWQSLVGLVTSATAIMYAFGPVSMQALRKRDGDRPRPYTTPLGSLLNPLGFIAANLIIYWGGYEATWKLLVGIFLGRVLFEFALARSTDEDRPEIDWRASSWIWPWLIGMTVIGYFGRYGGDNKLHEWLDLIVVAAFSLVVYFFAVRVAMTSAKVKAAVEHDQLELEVNDDPLLAI
jgi:amino acid transporter